MAAQLYYSELYIHGLNHNSVQSFETRMRLTYFDKFYVATDLRQICEDTAYFCYN